MLFLLKHYSKCDKRLFCIKFEIPNKGSYPFLEAVTNQMRCISRTGGDSVTPKRLNHPLVEGVPPSNGASDSSLSMKRIKLGEEKIPESEVKSTFSDFTFLLSLQKLTILLHCCFSLS